MHAAEEVEALDGFAPERLERASGVVDAVAGEPVPDAVCDPGGDLLRPGVAPVDAPAAHGVPPGKGGQELRDVVRVVLEVGVHGDDDRAAVVLEARVKGRRLPGVPAESEDADPRYSLAASLRSAPSVPSVEPSSTNSTSKDWPSRSSTSTSSR